MKNTRTEKLEKENTPYPLTYTEKFHVEWDAACATGRLSLTGLFNMIQITAGNHANICRFGFYDMMAAGQAWVLNRMKVHFTSMPGCNQEVRVTTWIHGSNGVISERNMIVEHGGQIFAQVSTVWACINYEKRTPEHIAVDYPDYLVLGDKNIDIAKAARVRVPETTELLRKYRVAFSDIDAMGHVNNIKYTQWILDSIPYEMALGITSGEVEVNFLAELHQGDRVFIEQGETADGITFVVRRESDGRPAFLSRYRPL